MIAEIGSATNAQIGTWLVIGTFVFNGIVALATAVSFFATRREVDKLDGRVTKLEDGQSGIKDGLHSLGTAIRAEMGLQKDALIKSGDARSSVLHNRINPVTVNLSEIKGMMEAFTQSFNNFTEVMKSIAKDKR